jgi:hypothetical protein
MKKALRFCWNWIQVGFKWVVCFGGAILGGSLAATLVANGVATLATAAGITTINGIVAAILIIGWWTVYIGISFGLMSVLEYAYDTIGLRLFGKEPIFSIYGDQPPPFRCVA